MPGGRFSSVPSSPSLAAFAPLSSGKTVTSVPSLDSCKILLAITVDSWIEGILGSSCASGGFEKMGCGASWWTDSAVATLRSVVKDQNERMVAVRCLSSMLYSQNVVVVSAARSNR